jgi:hypothetical protein
MTGFRNKQCLPHSPHSMMSDFYNLTQGKHRSNEECYDAFNSMVDTAEASGATIGAHPGGVSEILNMIARDANNPSKAKTAEAVATATQRYLAVAFLLGSDKVRYDPRRSCHDKDSTLKRKYERSTLGDR